MNSWALAFHVGQYALANEQQDIFPVFSSSLFQNAIRSTKFSATFQPGDVKGTKQNKRLD